MNLSRTGLTWPWIIFLTSACSLTALAAANLEALQRIFHPDTPTTHLSTDGHEEVLTITCQTELNDFFFSPDIRGKAIIACENGKLKRVAIQVVHANGSDMGINLKSTGNIISSVGPIQTGRWVHIQTKDQSDLRIDTINRNPIYTMQDIDSLGSIIHLNVQAEPQFTKN